MAAPMTTLVFVYGTLKTGEPNYYLMKEGGMDGCKPRGRYITTEKFPLVVASRYNVPYLLYAKGRGHNVEGELYEVNEEQLARMDDLEKHPVYYERLNLTLTPMTDDDNEAASSENVTAQAYFMVKYRPELLDLPMLKSYTDSIDGKTYVGPSIRKTKAPYWHEIHTGYSEPRS